MPTNIAIACQGGGSHAAYSAGALPVLLTKLESEKDGFHLVGISGTSGGAICALLAWYGILQGGPDCARDKLDAFWQSNCAQSPGERLWNDSAIAAMESLRCEIQFSPYEWPLLAGTMMLTKTWPDIATRLGDWNFWGRGDFFQLDALIKAHIDFALISAIGDFCSIRRDIKAWFDIDLRVKLGDGSAADQAHSSAGKKRLEDNISRCLEMPATILRLMDSNDFGPAAPLRVAFKRWSAPTEVLNAQSLKELSAKVLKVTLEIPQLLVGAVDIGSGEFAAFSSEKSPSNGGISADAILASAALPWMFEAVPVARMKPDGTRDVRQYWDGLLSQNPPIKDFISGLAGDENKKKPDEFWVLQLNPAEFDVKTLPRDIWDRRNELSGNLSLNQEISFIKAINKRIEGGSGAHHRHDKLVQVHRITLDSEQVERVTGTKLDALSKSDRNRTLMNALSAHGQAQAEKFLLIRAAMSDACSNLTSPLYGQWAQLPASSQATLATLQSLLQGAAPGSDKLVIDETTLQTLASTEQSMTSWRPHATARWHMRGTMPGDVSVRLEGESDFIVVKNGHTQACVSAIRITDTEALQDALAAPISKLSSVPPSQRPPTSKPGGGGRKPNA